MADPSGSAGHRRRFMNENDREELQSLYREQQRLQTELTELARQINRLKQRLQSYDVHSEAVPVPTEQAPQVPKSSEPSPDSNWSRKSEEKGTYHPAASSSAGIPPPPQSGPSQGAVPQSPGPGGGSPVRPAPIQPPPLPVSAAGSARAGSASPRSGPTENKNASIEIQLGTYWMVRIGIVLVLTGLIFFGNYAYQNVIAQLGPAGKVCLLYLAGGLLLGTGFWLHRRSAKPALRQYGQVLAAGGWAAVYFTTYAAHYLPALRIIPSPIVAVLLLMGWAAAMIVAAHRMRSEGLALLALLLAYYTSNTLPIGGLALVNCLILTGAALYFLLACGWTTLSFVSLAAAYFSHGFWQVHQGQLPWLSGSSDAARFWIGNLFLSGYWVMFTVAGLFARTEFFTPRKRALFLSLNNGALLALFLLGMWRFDTGVFWKFGLLYGGVLLLLSRFSYAKRPSELLTVSCYLVQGLVLVTLGFMTYFTGARLALVLAAQSVILLVLSGRLQTQIMRSGAYAAAALATGSWLLTGLGSSLPVPWHFGFLTGAFLVFNAIWSRRESRAQPVVLQQSTLYFTGLGFALWLGALWFHAPPSSRLVLLALAAIILTASYYAFEIPEFPLVGQGYLFISQAGCLAALLGITGSLPWWNGLPIIGATLVLARWWETRCWIQNVKPLPLAYGIIAAGLTLAWIFAFIPAREQFWLFALLSTAIFAGCGWLRKPAGIAFSYVFLAAGLWVFWFKLDSHETVYPPNLLAILLVLLPQQLARRCPARFALSFPHQVAMVGLGTAAGGWFLTRWILTLSGGVYVTIAWALYALLILGIGLGLKDRIYRWFGLGCLALALVRAVILDVWNIDLPYRILSFMGLGLVLLLLGFIYNKYQEQIKRWL